MLFDEEWNKEQLERMKFEYYDDGVEDGINKNKTEVARKMLKYGYNDTEILNLLEVTPEFIDPLRKETAMFVNQ